MNIKIGGERKRPRIALLGEFTPEAVENFHLTFPTVWEADTVHLLSIKVHPQEIEVLIIGRGINNFQGIFEYTDITNTICFSGNQNLVLPGLYNETIVTINKSIKSEEYKLPSLRLSLNKVRESELDQTQGTKNWRALTIISTDPFNKPLVEGIHDLFVQSALILDRHEDLPLATIYTNTESGKRYAWLPNSKSHQFEWVKAIVSDWAKEAPEAFPGFGDWTIQSEWMTLNEDSFSQKILELEEEKNKFIQETDRKIQDLSFKLKSAQQDANNGQRRLLTEQGDTLVEEVANIFEEIGFTVEKMDTVIESRSPKVEDLRLSISKGNKIIWEAIVEVRGYTKSGFQTADIPKISRFASFYLKEKGRLPDKRIYVVNGQIDLQPPFRDKPFASALNDLEAFTEDQGLVIWTVDLFKSIKKLNQTTKEIFKDSIINSTGFWSIKI